MLTQSRSQVPQLASTPKLLLLPTSLVILTLLNVPPQSILAILPPLSISQYTFKNAFKNVSVHFAFLFTAFMWLLSVLTSNSKILTYSTKSCITRLLSFTDYAPAMWTSFLPTLSYPRILTCCYFHVEPWYFWLSPMRPQALRISDPTQRSLLSLSFLNEVPATHSHSTL